MEIRWDPKAWKEIMAERDVLSWILYNMSARGVGACS